jgi:hypothetical protein
MQSVPEVQKVGGSFSSFNLKSTLSPAKLLCNHSSNCTAAETPYKWLCLYQRISVLMLM